MALDEDALYKIFDAARLSDYMLDHLCTQILNTNIADLTASGDRNERYRAVIRYAITYGMERELAAGLLNWGADKPALQNLLTDPSMALEPNSRQSNDLDLVRLENRVERLADKVDGVIPSVAELRTAVAELRTAVAELRSIIAGMQTDGAAQTQRVTITSRTFTILMFWVVVIVVAQISVLAWLGNGGH